MRAEENDLTPEAYAGGGMSEARMWSYLREKQQRDYLEMERITEKLRGGVVDVNWAEPITRYSGWMELKYLPEAAYARTDWKIPLLRIDQVLFLQRRAKIRGFASILMRIGDGADSLWMLFLARSSPAWRQQIMAPQPQPDHLWSSFPGCGILRAALLSQP